MTNERAKALDELQLDVWYNHDDCGHREPPVGPKRPALCEACRLPHFERFLTTYAAEVLGEVYAWLSATYDDHDREDGRFPVSESFAERFIYSETSKGIDLGGNNDQ